MKKRKSCDKSIKEFVHDRQRKKSAHSFDDARTLPDHEQKKKTLPSHEQKKKTHPGDPNPNPTWTIKL